MIVFTLPYFYFDYSDTVAVVFFFQIIQTLNISILNSGQTTGFIFVFTDLDVIHHVVEVMGMDSVRVLHRQMMRNGVEAMFVPSFPLDCDSFKEEYSAWTDIAHTLWYGVYRPVPHC